MFFELVKGKQVESHSPQFLFSDGNKILLEADRQHVVVDCAPSSVAKLRASTGETQHVCNICGSLLFIEVKPNTLQLEVTFSGHSTPTSTT